MFAQGDGYHYAKSATDSFKGDNPKSDEG